MHLRKNVQLTLEADFLVASSEVEGLEVVVVKDFGGPLGRKGRLGLKPDGLNPAKKPQEITITIVIDGGGIGFTLTNPQSGKDLSTPGQ